MTGTALITGATSGIGKACAKKFAANGWNIIITGRREERLKNLKASLIEEFDVSVNTLCFDVRNALEVQNAIGSLEDDWQKVNVLVNNAGLAAGLATIDEGKIEDWDAMIDTNIKGLLYITKAVIPLIKMADKGHIINIGSTAAKQVYEKGNVYCGTKHAVDAISQAMRIDLLKDNIKVTAVHPGAVETEFSIVRFKGDEEKAAKVYEGYEPLHPEDVAEVVYYCVNVPEHVCINDLVITPAAQANAYYFRKDQ